MPKPTSENLTSILKQSHGALAKFLQVASQLQSLNKLVHAALPQDIAKHVKVLNLSQGKLILEVDNSSWAAKLRFALPDLLSQLRKTPDFAGLIKIEQQMALTTHKASQPKTVEPSGFTLSQQACESLLSAISSTSDPKLKKSLEQFLAHYGQIV